MKIPIFTLDHKAGLLLPLWVTTGLGLFLYLEDGQAATTPLPISTAARLPKSNAFDDYMAAAKLLVRTDEIGEALISDPPPPGKKRKVYTPAMKAKLVNANAAALRRLRQGLNKPYLNPEILKGDIFPTYRHYRDLTRLLRLEGQVKAAKGDQGGAMQSHLDALHLGTHVQNGGVWISMLVGIACEASVRRDVWPLTERLTASQAKAGAKRMERIDSLHTSFEAIQQGEKRFMMASLQRDFLNYDDDGSRIVTMDKDEPKIDDNLDVSLGELIGRYGKNGTRDRYHKLMDKWTLASRKPFSQRPRPLSNSSSEYLQGLADKMNPISLQIEPMAEKTWLKERDNLTQHRLLTVALALRAYRLERGGYSQSLTDLAPVYLANVPRDPFAPVDPLRYRQVGGKYVLYSIGPDGRDDAGTPIDNPPDENGSPSSTSNARLFVNVESKGDIVAGINIY